MTAAVSRPSAVELSPVEMAAGLRAWAAGRPAAEAAVELLIGHGVWLGRNEFCELAWVDGDRVAVDPEELAILTFIAEADQADLAVLTLTVGLLGVEIIDPLADLRGALDCDALARVVEAVARCGRWPEHGAAGHVSSTAEEVGR